MGNGNKNIIYPELSYKIIGAHFDVFNDLGFGLPEKHYQEAVAKKLESDNISFVREKLVKVNYKENLIGKFFLDFLIANKIVVELKVKQRFGYVNIKQVLAYLKAADCKLAIIIYFTPEGVKYRRIVNIN